MGSVKQAQGQAGHCKKSERAMHGSCHSQPSDGTLPRKLTPVVCQTGQGNVLYHRIESVHAVIWQAGTNWAGPVRIQIYYGPECPEHRQIEYTYTSKLIWSHTFLMMLTHSYDTQKYCIHTQISIYDKYYDFGTQLYLETKFFLLKLSPFNFKNSLTEFPYQNLRRYSQRGS